MTDTRIDVRDLRVLRVRTLQLAAVEGLQFTTPHALPTTGQATTSPLPQPAPTRLAPRGAPSPTSSPP